MAKSVIRSGCRLLASTNISNEALHELANVVAGSSVGDLAVRVDDLPRARYQKTPSRPEVRAQGPKDGQPRILRQDRTEPTRRGAGDCNRLAAKYASDVAYRPRKPVDRVLRNTRNAVVVFRGDEQQAVSSGDRVLQT